MFFMHNQIAHELAERQVHEKRLRKVQLLLADQDDEELYAELAFLEQKIGVTDEWLSLLSPDQYFVVRLRLVDGKTWNCVARECSQQHDSTNTFSVGDLFRLHEAGIERIVRHLVSEGTTLHNNHSD